MSRSLIPRLCLLAVACLATVAWPAAPLAAQEQPPDAASADILVPAPIAAPQPRDYFLFRAPAPADAPQVLLPGGADEGTFFLAQAAAPAPSPAIRVVQAQPDAASVAGGEYWIGVQLEPLPELVKSQLKLERGMVVVHVFEDSPAAKAEFRVNDILLRAGDKDIKEPTDLIQAVNDAKEKELVITALRSGTETTLKVAPARRQTERFELKVSPETPHVEVVKALEELHRQAPDGDVRLFALRPGGVYARTRVAKFPSNLEVTIEKRGDKPATIRVKRIQEGEDNTWEVTEDKLGELPEEIRGHVQQMLSGDQQQAMPQALRVRIEEAHQQADRARANMHKAEETLKEYRVRVQPPTGAAQPQPMLQPRSIGAYPPGDSSVQAKLDAILKKLDQTQSEALQELRNEVKQLRRELEELRQGKK